MADIELVIKIPKEEYDLIVNDEACGLNVLTRAIANGTPLEEELHREKEQAYYLGYEDREKQKEALKNAVKIMCKYEEIKQIMNELNGNFYGSYLKDRQALEKIYEVIEDDKERND